MIILRLSQELIFVYAIKDMDLQTINVKILHAGH